MRIDQFMVAKKIAPSRAKAQELIAQECVLLRTAEGEDFKLVKKPSFKIEDLDQIEVKVLPSEVLKYVSRGGLKLEGALHHLKISFKNKKVLDLGQSTGGFTDCALCSGATEVIGFDVGHGQLHDRLKHDDRVKFYEGVNTRQLFEQSDFEFVKAFADVVVMDVSFISMTSMLKTIRWALKPGGVLISLVKPQFELEKGKMNKKGIVKSKSDYQSVENKVKQSLTDCDFSIIDYFESSILGGDGNREFFVYAKKNS